ncbi:MAG: polymer-forming cytoskeletal protein [Deltaproteobacteria bacterium]|nr:polymer-forming cytoskeletal protein [Deltaproteobacteria bacterium]
MKANQKNISIINKDCKLEGNLDFKGYLIVAGSIDGIVNAETIITEEDSHIKAKVKAAFLTIAGSFEGEIKVVETLTLLKTSTVNACIQCGNLIIEDGCTFNGKIIGLV